MKNYIPMTKIFLLPILILQSRKTVYFILFFSFLFSSCSNESNDSLSLNQNYISINGVKHSVFDEELSITFGGGNNTYTSDGVLVTKFCRLKIEDPNNILTSLLDNENLTNSLIFRFVYDADVPEGTRTTVNNIELMTQNSVVADYYSTNMPSTIASPGNNIYINIGEETIDVSFSNVLYGSDSIDLNLKLNY